MKPIFKVWQSSRGAGIRRRHFAGSALPFSEKPKKPPSQLPVDEKPIAREVAGQTYAAGVQKVAPACQVVTATRIHNTAYSGSGAPPGMTI